jgi:UDP-glucose 4-epimerase
MTTRRPAVLVTGAAGLIGSAVVRHLRRLGHPVVACDDLSLGTSRLEGDGIAWEECDVSEPGLSERLSRHTVDAVVHCAAHPGGRSLEEPSTDVRVNALGSMQVFEWCARKRIPVLYLSSSAVYGEQPSSPIPETAALRPATIYAVCKVACENYLGVLGSGYGLPWTVLRLFATYGAGHRPNTYQGIVNVMLTQILAGNTLVVKGSLERVRDLLHVDDAARAIVACLFNEQARGQILNVGTGTGVTIQRLIAMLCEVLGRRPGEVSISESAPTVGDPLYSVADTSRLQAITDFAPEHSLRDSLSCLVQARLAGAQR